MCEGQRSRCLGRGGSEESRFAVYLVYVSICEEESLYMGGQEESGKDLQIHLHATAERTAALSEP